MAIWDSIEERLYKCLALGKRSFISKGGRLTLIKSILTSLPVYQMYLLRMPMFVAKRLEKLQRNGEAETKKKKKHHLVN